MKIENAPVSLRGSRRDTLLKPYSSNFSRFGGCSYMLYSRVDYNCCVCVWCVLSSIPSICTPASPHPCLVDRTCHSWNLLNNKNNGISQAVWYTWKSGTRCIKKRGVSFPLARPLSRALVFFRVIFLYIIDWSLRATSCISATLLYSTVCTCVLPSSWFYVPLAGFVSLAQQQKPNSTYISCSHDAIFSSTNMWREKYLVQQQYVFCSSTGR